MFSIQINEKGGEQKRLDFDKPEVTIGRVAGNDIILPKGNVSKRHSRIVLKDGKFIIVDLKSTNGTYVNGRKINSPLVVKSTDKIYIGDFILSIEEPGGAAAAGDGGEPPTAAPPEDAAALASAATPPPSAPVAPPVTPPATRPAPPPPPRPTRIPPPSTPIAGAPPAADLAAAPPEGEDPDAKSRPGAPAFRGGPSAPPRAAMAPDVRPTIASEQIRMPEPAAAAPVPRTVAVSPPPASAMGSPLDKPVVAADRVSDQPTRMAPEAPKAQPIAPVAPTASAAARPTTVQPQVNLRPAAPAARPAPRPATRGTAALQQLNIDDPQRRRRMDLLTQVVSKVSDQLGLAAFGAEQWAEAGLPARLEQAVRDTVGKMTPLPIGFEVEGLIKEANAEINGAGPLDDLLADETVHEVAVASHDRIYVDKGSGQTLSERVFTSPLAVLRAVERLAARAGQRMEGTLGELRLDSGALLQVALPPSARVPTLVVRRSRKSGGRLQDLVNQGVLDGAMSEFLEVCMRERRNLVVSGYGRMVMMGALGGATAAGARVATVERVSELDLSGNNASWLALIGRGQETRNVIAHAVRMHPDYLIITDVRGPEALDVAAALCGGQGVVVGVDAASSRDAIARLESLGRLSGESPPRKALREEIAQAVHLAVHVGRTAAGAYRVMEISEVTLAEEGEGVELRPIFLFKPEGADGHFVSTGHVPAFTE